MCGATAGSQLYADVQNVNIVCARHRNSFQGGSMKLQVLAPLGRLAPPRGGEPWDVALVDRSVRIDHEVKSKLLPYLKACPVFLAWMEYTRDLIGDRFGVDGGSAIASDGVYYWRLDAIDYIREYDIAVPDEVVAHCESRGWGPPVFSRPEYLAIYQQLEQMLVPEFWWAFRMRSVEYSR